MEEIPENVEIVDDVDGRWMVLVNGFQWGLPTSTPDKSGAYPDTWETPQEARKAWENARMIRP